LLGQPRKQFVSTIGGDDIPERSAHGRHRQVANRAKLRSH